MDRLNFMKNMQIKSGIDILLSNKFDECMVLYDIVDSDTIVTKANYSDDHCTFYLECNSKEQAEMKSEYYDGIYINKFGNYFKIQADHDEDIVILCITKRNKRSKA